MPATRSSAASTDQDRDRDHNALTLEWRAASARRSPATLRFGATMFNRFKDATTVRAALLADLGGGLLDRRLLCGRHRATDVL